MVAVHDTVFETKTITIMKNVDGDTLKLEKTTERDRIRDRAQVKNQHERIVVKTDTVFIAVRDSSYVMDSGFKVQDSGRKSNFVSALKWIFWILVCVIILVINLKVKDLTSGRFF